MVNRKLKNDNNDDDNETNYTNKNLLNQWSGDQWLAHQL